MNLQAFRHPLLLQRRRPPPTPPNAEGTDNEDEDDDAEAEEEEEVVVALYNFPAAEPHDLSLVKGCEYIILEKNDVNWYKARNFYG